MNPHKMNKIDISQMSEQDQKAFKMYGKVPAKNILTKMQKDRKYFDSGDYMMSKAGVQSAQAPGTAIPTPEGLPHAFSPTQSTTPNAGSPAPIAISPGSGSSSGAGAGPGSQSQGFGAGSGSGAGPSSAQAQGQVQPPSPGSSTSPNQGIPIPGGGGGAHAHPHSNSQSSQESDRASPLLFAHGHGHGHAHSPGVGVGIGPEGMDTPAGSHRRRLSESFNPNFSRTSPPAVLQQGSTPSSSYPIQHPGLGALGSSPVKTSMLARRAQLNENE